MKSLNVNHRRLRCALDHAKLLYRTHVSDEVFDQLSSQLGQKVVLSLPVESQGRFQPLRVRSVFGPRMVLESRELRVCVWRARSTPEGAKRRNSVEADLHGRAFDGSKNGLDALEILRTALEELLFPDRGTTATQRRRMLSPMTFPGRTDVAVDIEVTGEKAHLFANREVFFVDDEEGLADHWCFHGSPMRSIRDRGGRTDDGLQRDGRHGDSDLGRTLSRKAKRHELVIYEKAKVRLANRKASKELKEMWRRREWTGSTNVLRCELRMMAEWFSVNAPKITFDEFLKRLPELFGMVTKRDRHLAYDPGSSKSKTRRRISPFWETVVKALGKLKPKEA